MDFLKEKGADYEKNNISDNRSRFIESRVMSIRRDASDDVAANLGFAGIYRDG
jgi:hypothetical protein